MRDLKLHISNFILCTVMVFTPNNWKDENGGLVASDVVNYSLCLNALETGAYLKH